MAVIRRYGVHIVLAVLVVAATIVGHQYRSHGQLDRQREVSAFIAEMREVYAEQLGVPVDVRTLHSDDMPHFLVTGHLSTLGECAVSRDFTIVQAAHHFTFPVRLDFRMWDESGTPYITPTIYPDVRSAEPWTQ